MFTSMKSRLLGGSALLVAMAVALGVAVAPAADDQSTQTRQSANELRVGTFDPEMAFQRYHGLSELIALSQRLQQEAQEAQMQGNQQRLMELQQEMQAGQMRIITQFQADVERVVPEIAKEHGLKIVAVEITYIDEELGEPRDITDQLVEKINEQAPQSEETDPFRPAPPQPGGFQE